MTTNINNNISFIMKRKFFRIAALVLAGMCISSCNSDAEDIRDPFNNEPQGSFYASSITAARSTGNISETKNWTNIVKDASNRVVQYDYDYKYETKDGDLKSEEKESRIYYFTNHNKQEAITVQSHLKYSQLQKGISSEYSQDISENIELNPDGYISRISTTIAHYAGDSLAPVIKTNERVFTYSGSVCTGSVYNDDDSKVTYTYDWNSYQLTSVTVLKDNHSDGIVEYDKFNYTYDNNRVYLFSGTQLLPFVQEGLPEVFASMGYFGKHTPYMLTEEVHNGHIRYNASNSTSTFTEIINRFSLVGDIASGMTYNAKSNTYSTYYIDFKK